MMARPKNLRRDASDDDDDKDVFDDDDVSEGWLSLCGWRFSCSRHMERSPVWFSCACGFGLRAEKGRHYLRPLQDSS